MLLFPSDSGRVEQQAENRHRGLASDQRSHAVGADCPFEDDRIGRRCRVNI